MNDRLRIIVVALLLPAASCTPEHEWSNPFDPEAASLDFDGDGVPNGEDAAPRDRTCGRTAADVNNCGECGKVCFAEHATASCTGGQCQYTCDSGWSDVNGDLGSNPSDGCECETEDPQTDVNNCGECGNVCGVDHKGDTCEGGSCGCEPGWSDPDGDPANGCECLNQSEGSGGEVCCEAANGDICCENAKGYQECEPSGGRGGPYVLVPAGTFWMGCREDLNDSWNCGSDETPQHEVRLSSYGIDVHEVTQAEYKAFVDDTGHRTPSCDWEPVSTSDHPVVCVDWNDLRAYCQWAGGDLPTEAQWEYAARGPMLDADDYSAFPWGTNEIDCDHAVIYEDGNGCGTGGAWPFCSKTAGNSPFGQCDMAGNVWEWCLDWYGSGYYASSPLEDPDGPASGSSRVLRGGSWDGRTQDARAAGRSSYDPTYRRDRNGGRCARPGQL